ncbi:MAG: ABC transporter permease [Myxococcota bacterium]|nr:ABC transporter permease [Myxococcota bacterium]
MSASEARRPCRPYQPYRPYRALLSARFRMMLQYRAAALAGVATQFFWGAIYVMIYEAFYSLGVPAPMSFEATITYVWLGQALLALQPWNHDKEIEEMIRRGHVAYELVRPLDLYGLWFVRAVAWRTAGASLRFLPIVFVAGFVLPGLGAERWALLPPDSGGAALLFVVSLIAAVALGAAITTLVHVSLLFTLSGEGITRLMPTVVILFSGMIIPIPFFPDWIQPLFEWLPFRGLADVPFRIYNGHIPVADAFGEIALVAAWTGLLMGLGRVLMARGTRRLVVQGG